LVSGEGLVVVLPGYLKNHPVGGVRMVELADPKAAWDFLVVWQRGKMGEALKSLLDALTVAVGKVYRPR